MIQAYIKLTHWQCWPFWVLGLTPSSSNSDIDKAARDLSSKIKLGFDNAAKFETPLGLFDRDEFLIREAKSKLQSPSDRLKAEFWFFEQTRKLNASEGSYELDNKVLSEVQWLKKFRIS